MDTLLVSCIVPTHNRSALLQKAIESITNQTYKNLEIIIVNDGSSDRTEGLIGNLKKWDSRIISFKNDRPKGPSAARNIGIEKARGEFIAFLDDDDQWLPNRISDALDPLRDCDVLLCSSRLIHRAIVQHYRNGLVEPSEFKKGNFFGGTSVLIGHSAVFKENNFDEDLFLGEDWDLYVRLAQKYRIGFLDKPVVLYNDTPHKAITTEIINLPIDQIEKRLASLYKHKDFLGSSWLKFRVADRLLSYIMHRDNKFEHIFYTVKRCGPLAVLRSFASKVQRNLLAGLNKFLR